MNDSLVLKVLNAGASAYRLHATINNRAWVEKRIKECRSGGYVSVIMWQRDCDMCERAHVIRIPASSQRYWSEYRNLAEQAEGPFSLRIVDAQEAEEFEPWARDLAMEAFENGRGMSAVV